MKPSHTYPRPTNFASTDAVKLLTDLSSETEAYWVKRGEVAALELFREMSVRVPAYKDFLKQHDVKPSSIKTVADFKFLPTIDKDNYLRVYPRADLCWDGKFNEASWVFSSTSGSTGEPFYFPRQDEQDDQYALTAELYLRTNFKIHERSTLYVDAFAMGVWIGGLFTYEALKKVAAKGYKLSIITPGINKKETIKAIKNLGGEYDQVIIGCYPPVLKDIIDDGLAAGLDWSDYNLGIVFSAEGFSETFRDYVIEKAALANPLTSTLNHYGTVDLGTMSHETPLAVLLRRQAVGDKQLYDALFGQIHKLPTLTQYLPEMFYFEEDGGNLICSANSGIPLMRYDLKDHGGIFTLSEITQRWAELGFDVGAAAKDAGISDTVWNLPFVYVYERSDFSVSFMGFQIYPESVRKALHERKLLDDVTGKFTMLVEYDQANHQELQIHVELKEGRPESTTLKAAVVAEIIKWLRRENPIYRMNYDEFPARVKPVVTFWNYEHPTHFGGGGKQKWIKK